MNQFLRISTVSLLALCFNVIAEMEEGKYINNSGEAAAVMPKVLFYTVNQQQTNIARNLKTGTNSLTLEVTIDDQIAFVEDVTTIQSPTNKAIRFFSYHQQLIPKLYQLSEQSVFIQFDFSLNGVSVEQLTISDIDALGSISNFNTKVVSDSQHKFFVAESLKEINAPTISVANTGQTRIGEDCPPNASICDCLLAGLPACQNDSDNDGLVDLLDNCRFVSNSGQQNCDGDTSGDACDNLSAVITSSSNSILNETPTGFNVCSGLSSRNPFLNTLSSQSLVVNTTTETITTNFCGPDEQPNDVDQTTTTDTRTCWRETSPVCDFPTQQFPPAPACLF